MAEAGAVILGGHSIEDDEPKYGLAVTGIVHPDRIVTNRGARPGDWLVLTKPLGTGVLATALKGGLLDAETERLLGETMAALNAGAARAMLRVGVNACTDITGFGLLGHLRELAFNSGVDLEVDATAVTYLPQARKLAGQGIIPAGAYTNRRVPGALRGSAGDGEHRRAGSAVRPADLRGACCWRWTKTEKRNCWRPCARRESGVPVSSAGWLAAVPAGL